MVELNGKKYIQTIRTKVYSWSPAGACVNCLYSCHILYLWHMGHTANF